MKDRNEIVERSKKDAECQKNLTTREHCKEKNVGEHPACAPEYRLSARADREGT